MISIRLATGLALVFVLAACGAGLSGDERPETLTLLTHDSFADGVGEETFAGFSEDTGIEVEVLAVGDAGTLVNQAVLTKDNPLADVLFGVDDTFLSRALDEGIFAPHESRHIGAVPQEFVDSGSRVTPIDFGDVCLNYDKLWFENSGVSLPIDLDDLRSDAYVGLVAVESPATSSPGLAFMLATIEHYGESEWLDFWADLRDNDVTVAPDWNSAYYGEFTTHGGSSSMVVSYASSPPAEVIFAEEPLDSAPTGVIEAGCYRQVEFAGILAGTEYHEAAGLLVDYMLSVEFQETIPLTWFVFPANSNADLPQEFIDHTAIPENPARLDAEAIAENRERWTNEWIAVMEG